MGVSVSKSSVYDLLIVVDEVDHIKWYCNLIRKFTSEALVGYSVKVVPISDHTNQKGTLLCQKVLFLVDERTNSVRARVPQWIRSLPCFKDIKVGKYLVVNVDVSVMDMNDGSMDRLGEGKFTYKVMTVRRLDSVFRWWPRFLKVILPSVGHVVEKVNLSYSEVFIDENGFGSVNDCDQTISSSLYHFMHRQQTFINLYLQETFRNVDPDTRILLINTGDDYSKSHLGKCLRSQSRKTLVILDRELDEDLLKGFEVEIFTPTKFMCGMFRLMKEFNAIDPSKFIRIPSAPIGPLEVRKLRSSILGNGLQVFIGLKWKGCIIQNTETSNARAAVTLTIERIWLRNQEWTVVTKGISSSQYRYEDSVSYAGVYRYRISCVNAWGTASSVVTADWLNV